MPINFHTIPLFKAYSNRDLELIFKSINIEIKLINKYLDLDMFPLSKLIREFSEELKLVSKANVEIEENYASNNKSLLEMITYLQIHDLISQKLEHIHSIHKGVIQDLVELNNVEDVNQTSYLSILLEIIQMNKEQLIVINKEYDEAVFFIKGQINEIESKIRTGSAINPKPYFSYNVEFEKVVIKIIKSLKEVENNVENGFNKVIDNKEKLYMISKIFTMDSERMVLDSVINGDNIENAIRGFKNQNSNSIELF